MRRLEQQVHRDPTRISTPTNIASSDKHLIRLVESRYEKRESDRQRISTAIIWGGDEEAHRGRGFGLVVDREGGSEADEEVVNDEEVEEDMSEPTGSLCGDEPAIAGESAL